MNGLKKYIESLKNTIKNPLYIRMCINVLLSLIFFAVLAALTVSGNPDAVKITVITGGAYIFAVFLTGLLYRFFFIRIPATTAEELVPALSNMTLDFMVKFYMPAVICDEDENIVWYNKALNNKLDLKESHYGKNIKSLCGHSISELIENSAAPDSEGAEVAAGDKFFRIKIYVTPSHQKKFYITVWNDRTELNKAYKRLKDEDIIIAYIVIDNLDELLQFVQDKYRSASADVAVQLKSWSQSVGGILKEYERDKFIFICEASNMENFIAAKFDILDKIRDIRVGEGSLPVTISMGISGIKGTLSLKERAAHSALDLALQRGGDQVVVKTDEGVEYYGGRTKTVQKRTKVKARVIANELIMLMSRSSNVLIMTHKYADFDAIGACAGIARLAFFCGAKVNIISNVKDLNLTKCFEKLNNVPEYNYGHNEIFVDAVEAQDLVNSGTLLVIVDVNNKEYYQAADITENIRTFAVIDHHRKTTESGANEKPLVSYIEPSASSTCELISEILEQVLPSGMLHKEEAETMFAGILLDTMQFSRNTGVRTFSAALYLRSEGANPTEAQAMFAVSFEDYLREAKFQGSVTTYKGIIAIAVNDSDGNTSADRIAAAKTADKLLKVNNITISFALCRINDMIHISARSSGSFNVQIILEKLGGGGHYDSAATQVKNSSMADALTKLKKAIDEYFSEIRR